MNLYFMQNVKRDVSRSEAIYGKVGKKAAGRITLVKEDSLIKISYSA